MGLIRPIRAILGCSPCMSERNFVCVTRDMETNIAGVFAAGDCVGASFQAVKAAGEGQIAALSAARAINRQDKEG